MNNLLTRNTAPAYNLNVETNHRGCPAPSHVECGGEVVAFTGVPTAHQVFLHREVRDGSRWNHDNAWCAFFVPSLVYVENHRRTTMPVNPCFKEKDLKHVSILFSDELSSICSVLRDITAGEDVMTSGAQCVILWCADSIESLNKVLTKDIKDKHAA